MNKSLSLLVVAVAMTATSCLAQETPHQQDAGYSNIPVAAQDGASKEALKPYEITLDDLSDTPWPGNLAVDEDERGLAPQYLQTRFITLEKGQDLVIHIKGVSEVTFAKNSGFVFNKQDQDKYWRRKVGGVYLWKTTDAWVARDTHPNRGWNNYWSGNAPLQLIQPQECKNGTFTFKRIHPGESTIGFLYTVIPHVSTGAWIDQSAERFNKQKIFVTCK